MLSGITEGTLIASLNRQYNAIQTILLNNHSLKWPSFIDDDDDFKQANSPGDQ